MKTRTMTRPRTIRTICCFTWSPAGAPRGSGLDEKFHLHTGKLDKVMILESVRCRSDWLSVDCGLVCALDVRDEIALRPSRQNRDLHAGLSERGERLGQFQFLACTCAGDQLDCAQRLRRPRWRR